MSSESLNTAGAFSQAKDLKNRIIFTILILIIYRLGTYVPLAGIDPLALSNWLEEISIKKGNKTFNKNAIFRFSQGGDTLPAPKHGVFPIFF